MLPAFFGGSRRELAFVATANGIFTESGAWFSATEDEVKRFASKVLEVQALPRLLADADVWIRLPQITTGWVFLLLVVLLPPVPTILAGVGVYVIAQIVGPAVVNLPTLRLLRVADNVLLQGLAYAIILSLLANAGAIASVWTGLAGFIVLRWGLLARIVDPLVGRLQRRMYSIPVPDQILRGMIIRTAIKHRIKLPLLAEMERSIRAKWSRS